MYRRPASRRQRKRDEGTLKIIDLRFRIDRQAATRRRRPSRRKAVPLFFLFARDINLFECYRAAHEAGSLSRRATDSEPRVSQRSHSDAHSTIAIRFHRDQYVGNYQPLICVLVLTMFPRDIIFSDRLDAGTYMFVLRVTSHMAVNTSPLIKLFTHKKDDFEKLVHRGILCVELESLIIYCVSVT